MSAIKSSRFSLKSVSVTERGVTYKTFRVCGWIGGRRVRRQFMNRDEALGAKHSLEVQAANCGEISARNTRLTGAQLAEAEAAFARLGERSLSTAVEWFIETYRPPLTEMTLEAAETAFLADRKLHVRAVTLGDYKLTLSDFRAAVIPKHVHDVKTADVLAFLNARQVGKKRWNNLRGDLHSFFEFCRRSPRQWTRENPVANVDTFRVPRSLPQIETAEKIRDMFAFLETWGGVPDKPQRPGFLVPYFALATFAGIRPSIPEGELWKIGKTADPARVVDTAMGVIRIGPEIAKTRDVRQIEIRPNLARWLERFPLKDYPICVPSMVRAVTEVRKRFGLGKDVLRHTFISMHVAKWKSLGAAALEAGNSETMIKKHYLNLASEKTADVFWSIAPALAVSPESKGE